MSDDLSFKISIFIIDTDEDDDVFRGGREKFLVTDANFASNKLMCVNCLSMVINKHGDYCDEMSAKDRNKEYIVVHIIFLIN